MDRIRSATNILMFVLFAIFIAIALTGDFNGGKGMACWFAAVGIARLVEFVLRKLWKPA